MDWTAKQRARRDAVHDASWAEYFTQPRIREGAVHLIIGDSLIRVRLLDVASMMEHSIPDDAFSDGIYFDRPRVMEWLNFSGLCPIVWACGVVMAKKKGDQLRFCCVFRYLNSVTVKDAYPIPRIDAYPIPRKIFHNS